SLQELQARRMDKSSSTIDLDPDDVAESLELPGADLSNEELSFRVIPRQADEFTCSRCFLVHHRSQLAEDRNGQLVCRECAAWRSWPRGRGTRGDGGRVGQLGSVSPAPTAGCRMVALVANSRAASTVMPAMAAQLSASTRPTEGSAGSVGGTLPVVRVHAIVTALRARYMATAVASTGNSRPPEPPPPFCLLIRYLLVP